MLLASIQLRLVSGVDGLRKLLLVHSGWTLHQLITIFSWL